MESWSAHHLFEQATKKHDAQIAFDLRSYAQYLTFQGLPVVFSLGHLAKITSTNYRMLRETVARKREAANYRMYAVKKRSGGRRFIHSVSGELLKVQRFINQEILQVCVPHPSSFAFHPTGGVRQCASAHCGARWLFQYDLKDFFYDVTEIDVYRVFRSLGYRELLSFEMARLCTTTRLPRWQQRLLIHQPTDSHEDPDSPLPYIERSGAVGVLPQGAPSSPMLGNLAARQLDLLLHQYAVEHGFTYTRYADDITISASSLPLGTRIGSIHRAIVRRIRTARFTENDKKTRVAGPGSKKLVLGLLVDGATPRLSKETYRRIDRHLHAAGKYGLEATAIHEGFESAFGFYNHLSGLVAFVKDVDTNRWNDFQARFHQIPTPWGDVC